MELATTQKVSLCCAIHLGQSAVSLQADESLQVIQRALSAGQHECVLGTIARDQPPGLDALGDQFHRYLDVGKPGGALRATGVQLNHSEARGRPQTDGGAANC